VGGGIRRFQLGVFQMTLRLHSISYYWGRSLALEVLNLKFQFKAKLPSHPGARIHFEHTVRNWRGFDGGD